MAKGAIPVKCPIAVCLTVLFAVAIGFAEIQFTAETERTAITPGEQAVVVVKLISTKNLGNVAAPRLPSTEAFEVLHVDQNQSQSSTVTIQNGMTIQKTEITYNFIYSIVAHKGGAFTFPSLAATIGGQTYTTQPINFTVTNEPVKNNDLQVSLILTKKTLYPGEQAVLTFRVARRLQSPTQVQRGFMPAIDRVEKSFGKEFTLSRLFTDQVKKTGERIGGEMYEVLTLRWALFPLTPGEFVIPAVPFEFDELQRAQRHRSDPFDDFFNNDFFGGGVQTIPKSAATNGLSIKVLKLPPSPAGFTGAVGSFFARCNGRPPAGRIGRIGYFKSSFER